MLTLIVQPGDREMAPQVASELERIVKLAAGPLQRDETLEQRMRRGWVRLGHPPWWRFVACWNGEGGMFSAQAAWRMQERHRERQRSGTAASRTEGSFNLPSHVDQKR